MAMRLVRAVALVAAHIAVATQAFAGCEIIDDPQALPGGAASVKAQAALSAASGQQDNYELVRDPATGRIAGVRDASGRVHLLEFGPLSRALASGDVPSSGVKFGKLSPSDTVDVVVNPCAATNNTVTLDIPTLPPVTVTGDRVKQPDFWVPVVQTLMPVNDGGGGGVALPPADKIERCKKEANDCFDWAKKRAIEVGPICDDAAKQIKTQKPGWDILISVIARVACLAAKDLTLDGLNNRCLNTYNECLNG